ncbi:FKBP-type peptidyl-prolyl cis-trans isomerase [Pedobacter cryoconitis]|uniref:peptidylprolyl isomerase n=1 Tax=Pedobacter cryoconitis TaxID=188932 RepID=A0A7X0J613_9SPHI|nr:FKBP-type peptidyl-prolyl cis-trans isomerase [Pedobacter cryoconitis]MBB6501779.1 FKBP-type peptidyl-prolyl cis-trans isomerase [Pedobacter cryoconitis]
MQKQIIRNLLLALLFFFGKSSLKAQITQFPFEFNGKHLYIKVQANQSDSLHFIFDTGATGASIDSAVAEKTGISKENRKIVLIAGSGGVKNYTMALHQNLNVRGAVIKNVDLSLVNFSSLSTDIGVKLDGILGYELLNQYVTKLDFDRKIISLYNQITAVDTSGYTAIPFEFSKNILIPRFPVSITLANGETFTGKVMFDTGNTFSLIVSTPFSKYHDFDSKLGKTGYTVGRGMNSFTKDQLAVINSMSFDGFKFGQMSIRLTVNDQAVPKDGYLGILGIEVIKRFNVILDYKHQKIYLKPNQAYSTAFNMEELKVSLSAKESKEFLEKNKTRPGIKVTSSGLQYKILKQGDGPKSTMTERVSLQYTAKLVNGQKLWSTYDNNKPWVHRLDKTLEGVREAVLMMPAGSKWILYIPSSLAFGDAGDGDIPPGAAIIFEVEVLKSAI